MFLFFFNENLSYQNFTIHIKVKKTEEENWIKKKKRKKKSFFNERYFSVNCMKTITNVRVSKEGVEDLPQVREKKSHLMYLYFAETSLVVLLIQVQYITQEVRK